MTFCFCILIVFSNVPTPQKIQLQKQWEETILIVIQNFTKITKKYLTVVESQTEEEQNKSILVLQQILGKIKHIMYIARNEIIIESMRFFHEFAIASPPISRKILPTIFDVVGAIKTWLQDVRQDSKEIKMMVNKFIPEVLEILVDLFSPTRNIVTSTSEEDAYEHHIFEILEKVSKS